MRRMSARGSRRYGSGRRLLSPGSFVRSTEKRLDSRSSWLKAHGRIYVCRDILDTFKTLKAQCVFSTYRPTLLLSCSICCRLRCEGNKGEKKSCTFRFFFGLSCNLEANCIVLLYFNSLKAKQAMKKSACTEEPSVVQEPGKTHEINLSEI